MLAIESSVARVEAALKKISKRGLAALAGIQRSNLSGAGTPGWNPTRRTLAALERAVDGLASAGNDNGAAPPAIARDVPRRRRAHAGGR